MTIPHVEYLKEPDNLHFLQLGIVMQMSMILGLAFNYNLI